MIGEITELEDTFVTLAYHCHEDDAARGVLLAGDSCGAVTSVEFFAAKTGLLPKIVGREIRSFTFRELRDPAVAHIVIPTRHAVHAEWVCCVAAHQALGAFVSCSADPVRSLAVHNGRSLVAVLSWPSGFTTLAFCRRLGLVVTGGRDGTLRVWSTFSAIRCVGRLEGHSTSVVHLALSDNYQHKSPSVLIASTSEDRTIRLWTLQDQVCLQVLAHHRYCLRRARISAILFRPEHSLLLVGGPELLRFQSPSSDAGGSDGDGGDGGDGAGDGGAAGGGSTDVGHVATSIARDGGDSDVDDDVGDGVDGVADVKSSVRVCHGDPTTTSDISNTSHSQSPTLVALYSSFFDQIVMVRMSGEAIVHDATTGAKIFSFDSTVTKGSVSAGKVLQCAALDYSSKILLTLEIHPKLRINSTTTTTTSTTTTTTTNTTATTTPASSAAVYHNTLTLWNFQTGTVLEVYSLNSSMHHIVGTPGNGILMADGKVLHAMRRTTESRSSAKAQPNSNSGSTTIHKGVASSTPERAGSRARATINDTYQDSTTHHSKRDGQGYAGGDQSVFSRQAMASTTAGISSIYRHDAPIVALAIQAPLLAATADANGRVLMWTLEPLKTVAQWDSSLSGVHLINCVWIVVVM